MTIFLVIYKNTNNLKNDSVIILRTDDKYIYGVKKYLHENGDIYFSEQEIASENIMKLQKNLPLITYEKIKQDFPTVELVKDFFENKRIHAYLTTDLVKIILLP